MRQLIVTVLKIERRLRALGVNNLSVIETKKNDPFLSNVLGSLKTRDIE